MAPKVTRRLARGPRGVLDRLRGQPSLNQLVALGLRLGERPHIASPVYIDGLHPWLIEIGDYVTLAPYVALITHDASLHNHTGRTRLGRVTIEDRVYVSTGAIILPGTTIGADSVVGAGAVVHGDVPAESLVLGNPAKVSPIKTAVAWQQMSAARSPSWPSEGWNLATGITEERKREQREALADNAAGYVPARAHPGSPFELAERRKAQTGAAED